MTAREMIAPGVWTQFLAPIGALYKVAYRIEEAIKPRNADNCFVVAMIGRKRMPHAKPQSR